MKRQDTTHVVVQKTHNPGRWRLAGEVIGIDVHKRERQVCILAAEGEVVEKRIRTERGRFTAHLAAVQAVGGHLTDARLTFAELDAAPELRDAPVLRELAFLTRASLNLAEARIAAPGSPEGARVAVRERLERALHAPAAAASSDLRGWIRLLERWMPPSV